MGEHEAEPRILLVEDNPLHARLVVGMFDEVWPGYDGLAQARRLDDALDRIAAEHFDCVLLDLVLPDADGIDAVRAVARAAPHLPIVVLSSHDDDAVAHAALAEGAQDYLVKGKVEAKELLKTVRYAMRRMADSAPSRPAVGGGRSELGVRAGIGILDREGRFLFCDEGVAEMLGRSAGEIVGRSIVGMTHPVDVEVWSAAFGRASEPFVVRLRHGAGHDQRVAIVLEPLLGASGEVEAYVAAYHPQLEEGTLSSSGTWVVMSGFGA